MQLTKTEKRLKKDFIKFLKEIKAETEILYCMGDDIKTNEDLIEYAIEVHEAFNICLYQLPDVVSIFKKYGIKINYDLKYKIAICFSKEFDSNDNYGLCLDFPLNFNDFSDSKVFEQMILARYNSSKETMLLRLFNCFHFLDLDNIPTKKNFNYSFNEMMEQYHNMLNFIEWCCKLISNESKLTEMRKQYQDMSKEINKLTKARKAFVSKNAAILYELADIART